MIPTTPNGTRTWRSSSPLASVEPRTTSPTGSGSAGDVAQPAAAIAGDPAVVEPQPVDQAPRACRLAAAAATSSALAARTSAVAATQRVGHRHAGRRPSSARVASASSCAASRARSRRPSSTVLSASRHGVRHAAPGRTASRRRTLRTAAVSRRARSTIDVVRPCRGARKTSRSTHLEADDLPARQARGLAVLVPHPQRERGRRRAGCRASSQYWISARPAGVLQRVQERPLLAEPAQRAAHDAAARPSSPATVTRDVPQPASLAHRRHSLAGPCDLGLLPTGARSGHPLSCGRHRSSTRFAMHRRGLPKLSGRVTVSAAAARGRRGARPRARTTPRARGPGRAWTGRAGRAARSES